MKRLLVLPVLAVALAAASAATGSSGAHFTLTARSSAYGKVLFGGRGFVLYAFTHDRRGGKSTCYGECAAACPFTTRRARSRPARACDAG
jgi:predicted lipoprotein with Yx(FWY)xxD motif